MGGYLFLIFVRVLELVDDVVSMTVVVSFEMKNGFYNEIFRTYGRSGLKQKSKTVFGYIGFFSNVNCTN